MVFGDFMRSFIESWGGGLPQKGCCPGVGPAQASIYIATVSLCHDFRLASFSEWNANTKAFGQD